MKIILCYEHYPVSIGRYWKRGFQKLGHEVFSIGHCTGEEQAWPGNPKLSGWEDMPDHRLEDFAIRYQIDQKTFAEAQCADLFVNVDASHYWEGPVPCPKVIIGTDPHCINYNSQRDDCDLFVCMQNCYSKSGDAWIPYAHDAEWHFHADVPHDHDVTFYGVPYTDREHDLAKLQASGISVEQSLLGNNQYKYLIFSEGSLRYSAGHLAYCRPSLKDLPTRFFEAMAYGNIPLITDVPDLVLFPELKEGWHYEIFDDSCLVNVVQRALADPCLEQRKMDCIEAVKGHAWGNRAQTLLDLCAERGLL